MPTLQHVLNLNLHAGTEQLSVERYFTSTGTLTYAYWIGLEWRLNRQ
jgi:hypothetical protein